jgi:hypothetical protein
MSKSDLAASTAASTNAKGFLARMFGTAFSKATPAERKALLADAVVFAKSNDVMEGRPVDIYEIEDLWDGQPDVMPGHKRVKGGHTGTHEGGDIITGPAQEASGFGADKMAREYSEPAPQGGVAETTIKLGEMLLKSQKAQAAAIKAQGRQLDTLVSAINALIDDGALTKALAEKALRKAESESDKESGSEDEEADEEAGESESGSGVEVEIENEIDDEEEDDEATKKAVRARIFAKNRLKLAKARISKAADAAFDGNATQAARHRGVAKAHIAKARAWATLAKAGSPKAVSKNEAIAKALRAAAKALPPEENGKEQEKFPATDDKPVGKSEEKKDEADEMRDTMKAMQAALEKSHQGLGVFTATVNDVLAKINGSSRGTGVPPVQLVKSEAGANSLRGKVSELLDASVITQRDADTAEDVIGTIEAIQRGAPVDAAIVKARITRMPDALQSVFASAAAA